MNSIKKILFLIGKKNYYNLYYILVLNIFIFFLEFLSIISIPIFISALLGEFSLFEKYKLEFIIKDNLIIYASALILFSFLLKNLFLIIGNYFQANFIKNIKTKISKIIFNHYFYSKPLDVQNLRPSVMARNVTVEVQGFSVYFLHLNKILIEITAALTVFLILFLINPIISSCISLVFIILSFFYIKTFRPKLKKKAQENQSIIASFNRIIFETFETIKDIKIYRKENDVINLFDNKVKTFEKNIFFFNIIDKFPKILLELVSIIIILLVTLSIYFFGQNFYENLPILILIVAGCLRLIPAFTALNNSIFYLRIHTPSLNIVYDQIKKVKELKGEKQNKKISLKKIFKNDLDVNKNFLIIDQVSFNYKKNVKLLENINFKIPKKSLVSIVGPTGSGKTTLQEIIMGQIKPHVGNIFYKNKNIHYMYEEWIKKISFVSQKTFLLDSSIKKNICLNFNEEEIDERKLSLSLEVSELTNKIDSLENKIYEKVGVDGANLSGGEKQRIALARAIYKSSEILFLDEFTSSLDLITEEKIVKNLRDNFPEITIIMITHKQELKQKSDLVLDLRKPSSFL